MPTIIRIILLAATLSTACRPLSSPTSLPLKAYDELLIPDVQIDDIPFLICPDTVSYNPLNALWMTYLGVSSYTRSDVLHAKLKSLGFIEAIDLSVEGQNGPYSAQAFYAEHPAFDFSVLSIRGTEFDEARDVVTDLNIFSKVFLGWGNVHSGFLDSYLVIEPKIFEILDSRPQNKIINLWLTGHSMGGAIAHIFASRLITLQAEGRYRNIVLRGAYSIGAPKFADANFAKRFDEEMLENNVGIYRIRNHADLITAIPNGLLNTVPYAHTGALVYLDKNGRLYLDKTQILTDSDYRTVLPIEPQDHLTARYFMALKNDFLERSVSSGVGCEQGETNKPREPLMDY
ncbi:MAG: lipase family protein [Proteobacteria bacterium]|nr:MAG: lipase family protein [Pseudomonadota bacterium]